MGLKITYSKTEGVLRSVGDPPNGVVSFLNYPAEDGEVPRCRVVIDNGWLPPTGEVERAKKEGRHRQLFIMDEAGQDKMYERCVPLEAHEVVDACTDANDARHLWGITAGILEVAVQLHAQSGSLEPIAMALTLAFDTREAISARWGGDDG